MANRQLEDYPEISLKPENLDGIIDFNDIFGRSGPIHIEVGSGKGTFLVNQSKAFEQINYLGIELDFTLMGMTGNNYIAAG